MMVYGRATLPALEHWVHTFPGVERASVSDSSFQVVVALEKVDFDIFDETSFRAQIEGVIPLGVELVITVDYQLPHTLRTCEDFVKFCKNHPKVIEAEVLVPFHDVHQPYFDVLLRKVTQDFHFHTFSSALYQRVPKGVNVEVHPPRVPRAPRATPIYDVDMSDADLLIRLVQLREES